MKKPTILLKGWKIAPRGLYRYKLEGYAYNHPHGCIENGEYIYSSTILHIDFTTGIAETLDFNYQLENVNVLCQDAKTQIGANARAY